MFRMINIAYYITAAIVLASSATCFEFAGIQFPTKNFQSIQNDNGKVESFEYMEFNYTLNCQYITHIVNLNRGEDEGLQYFNITITVENKNIAGLSKSQNFNTDEISLVCYKNETKQVILKAGHLGITSLVTRIKYEDRKNKTVIVHENVVLAEVRIKRKITLFEELAVLILAPLILINKCAFGAKIELSVLKHIFVQPVALCLCLLMQFAVMPLIAVLFSTILRLSPTISLALFVVSSCPGGGGGYVFSYLINGDVTLAIAGSLMSTLFAIAAMPILLGTYEHFAHVPTEITIPYLKIIVILFAIAIPISTGIFLNQKYPKFAEKFVIIIRPLSLFLIACGLVYLGFSSKYIVYGPAIGWLLCPVMPMIMFVVSIALSRFCGLSWPFSKAVSLESGMKNTVLGITVIELSFPQPEADLASVMILMITIGHTILPILWYIAYLIKQKVKSSKQFTKVSTMNPDSDSDTDESTLFITTSVK